MALSISMINKDQQEKTLSKIKNSHKNFMIIQISTKIHQKTNIHFPENSGEKSINSDTLYPPLYTPTQKTINYNFLQDQKPISIPNIFIPTITAICATPLKIIIQQQKAYSPTIYQSNSFKVYIIMNPLQNSSIKKNNGQFLDYKMIFQFDNNFIMNEKATSQIEKHFLIGNVYKRSRKYFDIMKLNHLEHQQEKLRRAPENTKETIESRVEESFICSEKLLTNKVHHDIDYFYGKVRADDSDEVETTYTARSKNVKTVDMRKMMARSDFQKEKLPHRNEQQFNNFSIKQVKPRKSLDFETFIGRNKNGPQSARYANPQNESPSPQRVGKIYEKVVYDKSNLTCFVNYQKNDRHQPKPEIDNSPIYDLAKINRGESLTKKNICHQSEFYHGHGKASPSQLDNKILKQNQYFWKSVKEQRQRLYDYSVVKRKEDEVLGRLKKILDRKKLPDQLSEMCDQKYFRRKKDI